MPVYKARIEEMSHGIQEGGYYRSLEDGEVYRLRNIDSAWYMVSLTHHTIAHGVPEKDILRYYELLPPGVRITIEVI